MKKNIFIMIHDMESGGAQKSLISFLKCLVYSGKIRQYNIDLMIAKPRGVFYNQIPDEVHVLEVPNSVRWLGTELCDASLIANISLRGIIGKIKWIVGKRFLFFDKKLNEEQRLWSCWKNLIPTMPQKYDIAISYMNGFPNYYVMDKVTADKKVLWIHNEYQKIKYNQTFDQEYYTKCDRIITISSSCVESFIQVFPHLINKVSILENITICKDILYKGECGHSPEFESNHKLKLLTIARLSAQKGIDLAIEAAIKIKEKYPDFLWLVIGEGPDRKKLQAQIDAAELNANFQMIGIRENPYPYIKECDIFVQSSRFEGKSIVLDEAKIYCKPIVVTGYSTVYDSICNEENGLIVPVTGEEIANGVIRMKEDTILRTHVVETLRCETNGNEHELDKYISIMF